VIIDHRTQLDFLDLDDVLVLARLSGFLLFLVLVLAEVHQLHDRRLRHRCDLYQV
jgi:hypothetical protein